MSCIIPAYPEKYTPHSIRRGTAIWQFDMETEKNKIDDTINYLKTQKCEYHTETYINHSKTRGTYLECVIYTFLDNNDIESIYQ